jgi:type II secretory pathway component PulF
MKLDEFAFFNQQLAAMLRDGFPLEGALRRLCQEMRAGTLRTELQLLEADLARGVPLAEALPARRLPELYQRMILVGVKSNDLPGALTMLADYFQRQSNLWTRLKGLMVYPLIVLLLAFFLACFLSYILGAFLYGNLAFLGGQRVTPAVWAGLWVAPVFFGLVVLVASIAVAFSATRRMLRWRLPAFREASLAQVASVMWLMLKNGVPLDDALALVEQLEQRTRAGNEITQWRRSLASGRGKFSEMTLSSCVFPPLFVWTVAQSGEDLAAGFQRAAELYQARAVYRSELFLYSILPCSVLSLAAMIIVQILPVFITLIAFLNGISGS